MKVPHFFDTNILLYAVSTAPREADKRTRAEALLLEPDGALSVQVLQEFYVQAIRVTGQVKLAHEDAVDLIRAWSRFRVQDMTMAVLERALNIKAVYGFSYWDSAVIAAASTLGCRTLYTEDLSHGQQVEGVIVINPFR